MPSEPRKTLPVSPKRAKELARQQRKLQRQEAADEKALRGLIARARIHAIEHDNGNAEATEHMRDLLEFAVESGLSEGAISVGAGMVAKIDALLDIPPSQAHALGLLLNAHDLIANFDIGSAAAIIAEADKINTTDNVEHWQAVSTPMRPYERNLTP